MTRNIISAILVIAAGAIFFLYTKPTYDSVQAQQASSAQYDDALAKAAQLQAIKQTLLSKYNSLDPATLARLNVMLPNHVDNIGLILDLDSVASKYGLPLENVDVSSPNSANSSGATGGSGSVINPAQAGQSVQIGAASNPYQQITIKFQTSGSYPTFIQFITALESSLRIVDLVSLNISRGGSQGGVGLYTYDVTLRTYWIQPNK